MTVVTTTLGLKLGNVVQPSPYRPADVVSLSNMDHVARNAVELCLNFSRHLGFSDWS
ncbi:hypothetical protein ACFP1C_07100 [Levilactobacillus fujinensis]|uniref:Uncharacterized protein n=1 Tax=Levilactobacillus fujinensis TaxID=2486024 RepID=A0ABW1TFK3_9LACO